VSGLAIGFTLACAAGFIGMSVGYGTASLREHKVHPGLWLTLATLSIFWLEAPYDWAMYAQFREDLWRLPDWGPIGATHGQLPALAIPGYVLYFGVPTVIAVTIARRLIASRGWRAPQTLLATGLAVGFTWDACFETLGTRIGLWRFARTAPGLVLWGDSKYQVPVYCFIAMGVPIMLFTYMVGRRDDRGDTLIEGWARKRFSTSNRARLLATGAGFVLMAHAIYLMTMIPHVITKVNGQQTTVSEEELFTDDGIPNQPK
jgi:hypothetical protein